MSELEKLQPLVKYIGWFEAAHNWILVLTKFQKLITHAADEDKKTLLDETRKWEAMLGSVMLHIHGLYPLESGWELDE